MNFIRRFMERTTTDEISLVPKGKFYLTRAPNSPKGSLECLYNDAVISIKKTTRPFYYQLSVRKVYQEGEIVESSGNDYDSDDSDGDVSSSADIASKLRDEWTFIILQELQFRLVEKRDGTLAICWLDVNGDVGDTFEFVIDDDVHFNEVAQFKTSLSRCLFELKYHRAWGSDDELDELETDVGDGELTLDDVKKDLMQIGGESR